MVVADGYRFDAAWQRQIKIAGFRLLMLDDYGHADHYCADLVLNQNLHATEALYARREPGTRLLLGIRTPSFAESSWLGPGGEREIPPRARKVFVTLGGSDPDNVTGKVIQALADLPGPGNGGSDWRQQSESGGAQGSHRHAGPAIRLVVDTVSLPELMAWADVAVAAGGTTSWELAFMGCPFVVLVLAENQAAVAEALARQELAHYLGRAPACSAGQIANALGALASDAHGRSLMSHASRALVDGLGAQRVSACLWPAQLAVRRAGPNDRRLLWEWANQPGVRSASFDSAPIPWHVHVAWFERKLAGPRCVLFIGENGSGLPLGQVVSSGTRRARPRCMSAWRRIGADWA